MRDGGMAVGGRLDDEFDGFFDYRSFGDADQQAILEVGCVQGYEGVGLVTGVARQVSFDQFRRGLGEFGDLDAGGGGLRGRRRPRACPTWLKVCAGDGGYAGEAPVLVMRCGEAEIAKALAGLDREGPPDLPQT